MVFINFSSVSMGNHSHSFTFFCLFYFLTIKCICEWGIVLIFILDIHQSEQMNFDARRFYRTNSLV